jgi:D-glycero-beta-D-manno-heptose 1-phosphate adenylyltransferase
MMNKMNYLHYIESKILDAESLGKALAHWRFEGQKIVFTNGCFDLLHSGHLQYLAQAKNLGHQLVIGLNSDASTKRLKGAHRPINDEKSRSLMLAALVFVDAVVLFEEDTPLNLIQIIQPDILVKGGDYNISTIVGADLVQQKGGFVTTLPFLQGYSTTNIEEKILKNQHS